MEGQRVFLRGSSDEALQVAIGWGLRTSQCLFEMCLTEGELFEGDNLWFFQNTSGTHP